MRSDWKTDTIENICVRICSGGTPSRKHPEYYLNGSIPWLNTSEIDYSRIYKTENKISAIGLKNSSAKWIPTNAVIVAMYGATAGKVAISGIPLTTNQACCNLIIDEKYADYRYVYYYLCHNYIRLSSLANGGAQQNLSVSLLKNFQIVLPKVEIQKKIAAILSALDEKIATNRAINDNLQQQAFSIFDNLIANTENNDCNVSDYAFLNPKRTLAKNQVARSIDMSQLSTNGAFPSGWEMKPFNGGMRFTNGDTLLARITPCLENGKTAFIDFLDDGEVAFGSTEYIVLAPKNDTPPEMLYCLARYPAFVDYAVKNMNGSSGRQRVSAETVGQYRLPLFDKHSLVLFKEVVSPMFLKMRYNSLENMRLAELRDALLPKLMSGEIDVSAVQP